MLLNLTYVDFTECISVPIAFSANFLSVRFFQVVTCCRNSFIFSCCNCMKKQFIYAFWLSCNLH